MNKEIKLNSSIGNIYPNPLYLNKWKEKHWMYLYLNNGWFKCRINIWEAIKWWYERKWYKSMKK